MPSGQLQALSNANAAVVQAVDSHQGCHGGVVMLGNHSEAVTRLHREASPTEFGLNPQHQALFGPERFAFELVPVGDLGGFEMVSLGNGVE